MAVLVDRDAGLAQREFGLGAENAFLEDIDQHEVIVGSAGDDAEAGLLQALREHLGVGDDLRGVGAELGPQRLSEGNSLGGDDVHERTALLAGEDRLVDGRRRGPAQQMMRPARGPRSVLCVVVVVMCACGTGEGCTPPATRPAMWAMSKM